MLTAPSALLVFAKIIKGGRVLGAYLTLAFHFTEKAPRGCP